MLTLNLKAICAIRDIPEPYSFLVKAGFSRSTAHNLLTNRTVSLQLRHVDKLCSLLHCTPNDLLIWSPTHNQPIAPDHPLRSLKRHKPDLSWKQTLRTTPLHELETLITALNTLRQGQGEGPAPLHGT